MSNFACYSRALSSSQTGTSLATGALDEEVHMLDRTIFHQQSRWSAAVILLALAVAGCAAEVATPDTETTQEKTITTVQHELRVGDRGPDVKAVLTYLSNFGYFPNPKLQEYFPYWIPLISKLPEEREYFGAELEHAVRLFQ